MKLYTTNYYGYSGSNCITLVIVDKNIEQYENCKKIYYNEEPPKGVIKGSCGSGKDGYYVNTFDPKPLNLEDVIKNICEKYHVRSYNIHFEFAKTLKSFKENRYEYTVDPKINKIK
jgi:hypothetical protein